mmetsp:Transcript_75858/g.105328  ORF Transcript_75858/g.105328 Transcript_75858/m.105328 type:complete len:205 (+) Transcript_75858:261-875(+)
MGCSNFGAQTSLGVERFVLWSEFASLLFRGPCADCRGRRKEAALGTAWGVRLKPPLRVCTGVAHKVPTGVAQGVAPGVATGVPGPGRAAKGSCWTPGVVATGAAYPGRATKGTVPIGTAALDTAMGVLGDGAGKDLAELLRLGSRLFACGETSLCSSSASSSSKLGKAQEGKDTLPRGRRPSGSTTSFFRSRSFVVPPGRILRM